MRSTGRSLPIFDNHYGDDTLIWNWQESRELAAVQAAIKAAGTLVSTGPASIKNLEGSRVGNNENCNSKRIPSLSHPEKPLSAMSLLMASSATPLELRDKERQWACVGCSTYRSHFDTPKDRESNRLDQRNTKILLIGGNVQPPKGLERELIYGVDATVVPTFEGIPSNTEYGLYLSKSQGAQNLMLREINCPTHTAGDARCLQGRKTEYQGAALSFKDNMSFPNKKTGRCDISEPRYLTNLVQPSIIPKHEKHIGETCNVSQTGKSETNSFDRLNTFGKLPESDFIKKRKSHENARAPRMHRLSESTVPISQHSTSCRNQSAHFTTTKIISDRLVANSCFLRSLPQPSLPL